jgi:hypothetical protein
MRITKPPIIIRLSTNNVGVIFGMLGSTNLKRIKVGKQLIKFRERMESTFRPLLGRNFKGAAEPKRRWWKPGGHYRSATLA